MSIFTRTSNWSPSFFDGRVSTWVTVPLKFSIVLRILAKEPMPSLKRKTSAAFCTVCSLSGHSAIVFASTTSSSVNPTSKENHKSLVSNRIPKIVEALNRVGQLNLFIKFDGKNRKRGRRFFLGNKILETTGIRRSK